MTGSIAGHCRRWLPVPVAVASALAGFITVAPAVPAPASASAAIHEDTYQPLSLVLTAEVAQRTSTHSEDRPHVPAGPGSSAGVVEPQRLDDLVVASGSGSRRVSTGDPTVSHRPVPADDASFGRRVGDGDPSLSSLPADGDPVQIPLVVAAPAEPNHDHARSAAPTASAYLPEPDLTSAQTRGP